MIKESEKIVKKGSERMLGSIESVARSVIWGLGTALVPRGEVGSGEGRQSAVISEGRSASFTGSPLDNVGLIPEELRRDPFPGGSVPWSIQEAEEVENRAREMMIWKVALLISWSITAVALLRSIGFL
jgi:hypothetical protein